jgi:hypothetical protein
LTEALRLWLRGEGICAVERLAQLDRKTGAAIQAEVLGLCAPAPSAALTDEFSSAR